MTMELVNALCWSVAILSGAVVALAGAVFFEHRARREYQRRPRDTHDRCYTICNPVRWWTDGQIGKYRGQDSNLHGLTTGVLRLPCVYQFRHLGTGVVERRGCLARDTLAALLLNLSTGE